jgi:hypothetical protein
MDSLGIPPETSNFYCLPGRAGGTPIVLGHYPRAPKLDVDIRPVLRWGLRDLELKNAQHSCGTIHHAINAARDVRSVIGTIYSSTLFGNSADRWSMNTRTEGRRSRR